MTWITLLTTSTPWQAELMEQLLAAHDIPTKIIDLGVKSYLGSGTPAALQVRSLLFVDCTATIKSPRRPIFDILLT